jgi:hypothetical protein
MQIQQATQPDPISDLAFFLKSLGEEGRAVISGQPLAGVCHDAVDVLRQMDELSRNELALELPAFSPEAALWGARLFYQLCGFVVCRDIGEEQIQAVCAVPCPEPRRPQSDWSVDLTLRHLPKLFKLATQLSNADPLIVQMKQVAAAWPMSSVGIAALGNVSIESFAADVALRRLYADRIIAMADSARLGDQRVDDLLRADLGAHHDLAPMIAAKLFETTHDTH